MQFPFEVMYRAADEFELLAVVSGDGVVSFLFELFDFHLDGGLVDADDVMVLMHIEVECLADSHQKVILVHLGVALHGFVIDAFGDVSKLGYGLLFEFFIAVSHVSEFPPSENVEQAASLLVSQVFALSSHQQAGSLFYVNAPRLNF
jgi:hypothetical protein